MSVKKITGFSLCLALCLTLVGGLLAHDDGHKRPKTLPAFGPHGGKYAKLTKHYAEAVVRGNLVTVYILEKDVKYVAEDATKVSVTLEIPRKSKKKIKLRYSKKKKGYVGRINIPKRTRRVYFHIKCKLDRRWEKGKVLYEPKR